MPRQFVRYLVGFSVGVGLGCAPFLGRVDVPGFDALIDLFPPDLQNTLIPLAAFAMGTLAVIVQFYARENLKRQSVSRWFPRVVAATVLVAVALTSLYFLTTTPVVVRRNEVVTFVTGFERRADCQCGGLGDAECIKQMSVDPAAVAACWGDRQVKLYTLLLSLLYLATMSGFGTMIGLLLLQGQQPAPARKPNSKRLKSPKPPRGTTKGGSSVR